MKICNMCNKTFDDSAAFCPTCGSTLTALAQTPETMTQTEPQVNVCKNCGAQLTDGAVFCHACGASSAYTPEPVPQVNVCKNCGALLADGTVFCPSCGTLYGEIHPVPPIKQHNPKFEKFKSNLKLIFTNPGQAIDNELEDKNIITALISCGILLVSFVVMFLCLAGKVDSEFGVDELYGLGIVAALFCTIFFMVIPSATAFISSKLSGKQLNPIGTLSANGLKTIYISAFLILTGFSALISVKIFAFMLLLTGMMNTFLSVSYINRVSGNTLNSAKSMWSTYAVYAVLKIIATAIIYGILSSILEDLIEGIMEDFFYSSLESMF